MGLWKLFGRSRRQAEPPRHAGFSTSLVGHYEVRGERIVGSIRDDYEPDVESMHVDIFKQGHLIVSCPAVWRPEHRRYDFTLQIEGRFTGQDLVRENVVLIARDSDGKRGRVLLDGAAQLELVRDYLAVPSVMLLDLDFTRGGNAKPYLGAGWSGAEKDFTWTADDESFIQFDTPSEPGTYALRLTLGPHVHRPELLEQELSIFVNETLIRMLAFTEPRTYFNEITFKHDAFEGKPRTVMRLHHPNAARPSDFGHRDGRRLALSFKRLTLARLLQDDD